ncbi:hypothetical protein GCM10009839_04580 [Catenulispora yoronensis]|uniref:Glycosyltransferase RgtA/B/C/D-like domain-containing protein n=1 Tax=Catenulispora yoronensis TaxID=450799 RepID=A0ABP5F2X6_9ACTN
MTATASAPPAEAAGATRAVPSAVAARAWTASRGMLLEAAAAFAGAAWMLLSTATIRNFAPLERNSQVSGLASLQIRFVLPALAGVALLVLVRNSAPRREWASRAVFPLLPGLMSGFVGGGVLLALRGVALPLNGTGGDAGDMERWTLMLQHGQMTHPGYPPLYPRIVWFVSKFFFHDNVFQGLKFTEIVTAAVLGPAVYLAWRLCAGRAWACAIACLYTGALSEPYKAYEPVVLGILLPIVIAYVRYLRSCADRDWKRLAGTGLLVGLGLGEIFILFSGPFYWMAIGIAVAALAVFPWAAWRDALVLLAATGAGFLLIGWHLLLGLLDEAPDPYFFFQTDQDPGYPFLYLTDLPGPLAKGVWPPIGEAGGIDVYAALAVVAAGVAIWLGIRKLPVLVTVSVLAGCWIMRFHLAAEMFPDKLVRYWPRTTSVIIYCFLILAVFAVIAASEKLQELYATLVARAQPATAASESESVSQDDGEAPKGPNVPAAAGPVRAMGTAGTVGTVGTGLVAAGFALTLFAGMAGSANADKFMPKNDGSPGQLAFNAHHDSPHNLRLGATLVNGK